MNLVYFGTSSHSVILLEALRKSTDVRLKLVITKPDKPVGRHQKLTPSAVKKWCIENKVPYTTPTSLKGPGLLIGPGPLGRPGPDTIGLVADYGLIIPHEMINLIPKGIVNIHFSLLPKYRGAAPVTYTILNGDKETGITFLLTTAEMDKGDIIKQIPVKITEDENDETLYQKLFKVAGEAVIDVLKAYINGDLKPIKQDGTKATYTTPSGKFDRTTYVLKEDARIDFSKSPKYIERAIRAFYPWPVAWTTLKELSDYLNLKPKVKNTDLKIKIHKAHLEPSQSHPERVQRNEGSLIIDELQIEGKNKTNLKSFKNGYLGTP